VFAIAASCFVAFPSLSPQVGTSAPVLGAKGDRADIRPLDVYCGAWAWPYFDAACARMLPKARWEAAHTVFCHCDRSFSFAKQNR